MLIENGKIGKIDFYNKNQNYILSEDLHILYNLKNSVKVELNDSEFRLEEKDLIIIPVNGNASIYCSSLKSVYLDVSLNKKFLEDFLVKGQSIWCTPNEIGEKNYQELSFLLGKLCRDFTEQNQTDIERTLFEMVMTVKSGFLVNLNNTEGSLSTKVKEYIQQNFNKNITLEVTANELNVTPQYLSNYFKKQFNITFLHYLNDLKLDKSIQLLSDPNYKIINVAYDSGFNSVSTFNRSFKRKFKISPLIWRKRNKSLNQQPVKNINQKIINYAKKKNKYEEIGIDTTFDKKFENKIKIARVELSNLNSRKVLKDFKVLKINTLMFDFDYEKEDIQNYIHQIEKKIGEFIRENINVIVKLNLNESISSRQIIQNLNNLFEYFANLISINRVRKWGICFSGLNNISIQQFKVLYRQIQDAIFARLKIKGPILYEGKYQALEKINSLPLTERTILILNIFIKKTNIDTSLYYLKELRHKFSGPIYLENLTTFRDNYSLLNDTELRAKAFLEFMLKHYKNIDGVVINTLVDKDNSLILNGDKGIETKEWLPKPIYHALHFFNLQGKYVLSWKSNCAISWNGGNDYSILMLCSTSPSQHEFKLTYDNYPQLIKKDHNQFVIRFKKLKAGKYKLKVRKVNSKLGNIIEEYKNLDYSQSLSLDEFMYLKSKIQPEMKIQNYTVQNTLELFFNLKQDEIIFAHLIYLY